MFFLLTPSVKYTKGAYFPLIDDTSRQVSFCLYYLLNAMKDRTTLCRLVSLNGHLKCKQYTSSVCT